MPVAVLTGASRGLGRALAGVLAGRGWDLVVDGRDAEALRVAAAELERAAPAGRAAGSGRCPGTWPRRGTAPSWWRRRPYWPAGRGSPCW